MVEDPAACTSDCDARSCHVVEYGALEEKIGDPSVAADKPECDCFEHR